MRLALLVAAAALAGCAKNYAYLNTSWGMNEKSVAKARPTSQTMAASSGDKFRFEHTVIDGHKATVAYRLGPAGLAGVTLVFEPFKTEKADYLQFYRHVRDLLAEKYGAPEAEAAASMTAAQANKYRIPEAAASSSKTVWRTALSVIELSCGGECDGSSSANSVSISYQPPVSRTEGL